MGSCVAQFIHGVQVVGGVVGTVVVTSGVVVVWVGVVVVGVTVVVEEVVDEVVVGQPGQYPDVHGTEGVWDVIIR